MANINKPKLTDLRNSLFKQKCSEDNLKLVKEMIERDTEFKIDLIKGFLIACSNGSLTVLRHFLETPYLREKINLENNYGDLPSRSLSNQALIDAHLNGHSNIEDYLIFEINIDITASTRKTLKFSSAIDLIHKIEKRDLFFQMKEEEINKNKEIKKIKI